MNYKKIAEHYDLSLEVHKGNKLLEVDWSNDQEATSRRYAAFIDFSFGRLSKVQQSVLDFGAGTGTMFSLLPKSMRECYTGLDISAKMIEEAQKRYPDGKFICQDILEKDLEQSYDYVIINGVFTIRKDLDTSEMVNFTSSILSKLWEKTNKGLAFNFMDSAKIPFAQRRHDLCFMNYEQVLVWLIEPLKPKGWVINANYGCYDSIVEIYK